MFNKKNILVTGGTGSFGSKFIFKLLKEHNIQKIIIYSRDEAKQFKMQSELTKFKNKIEYVLGDIRDYNRLSEVMNNVDYLLHSAALKQVPAAEFNPSEFIKTNILGTENTIKAAINAKVKKCIMLSTDKASNPINLYGATKLVADKLFISGNYLKNNQNTKFSVVRYGNVAGSRGSIYPFLLKCYQSKKKYFPITHKQMTRFWITLDQSCEFVFKNFQRMIGGEIFVPKIPSIYITDLANAIDDKMKKKIIGIRPGEKLNEIMFSYDDSRNAIEFKDYYLLFPSTLDSKDKKKYLKNKLGEQGKLLSKYFEYNSSTNKKFLSIEEIKKINKTINDQLKI